jgi:cysteinyl-tRNA synthetase
MATRLLGPTIDFHCGGSDLVFPHHENEIAQSEGAYRRQYVNYWLHNGYISLGGEKMSKSRGNMFTARELLQRHPPLALRLFLLSAGYRRSLSFSEDRVKGADAALCRLWGTMIRLYRLAGEELEHQAGQEGAGARALSDFNIAMTTDFNTPRALGALFRLKREADLMLAGGSPNRQAAGEMLSAFCTMGSVLGLLPSDKDELSFAARVLPAVDRMLAERHRLRSQGEYRVPDTIRRTMRELQVVVADEPQASFAYFRHPEIVS